MGLQAPNWFQTPKYVIVAIGILVVWCGFGNNLIINLAAIVEVSAELIEAAKLENTSNWTIVWKIILPLTSPTALYVFITTCSLRFTNEVCREKHHCFRDELYLNFLGATPESCR